MVGELLVLELSYFRASLGSVGACELGQSILMSVTIQAYSNCAGDLWLTCISCLCEQEGNHQFHFKENFQIKILVATSMPWITS